VEDVVAWVSDERRGCGAASMPLEGLADESVAHCVRCATRGVISELKKESGDNRPVSISGV
jgi:hypothetical protein